MQRSNRSRRICASIDGPAHRVAPCGCGFSGEIEGAVTSAPVLGSSTRVAAKNSAAPRNSGYTRCNTAGSRP